MRRSSADSRSAITSAIIWGHVLQALARIESRELAKVTVAVFGTAAVVVVVEVIGSVLLAP